MATMVTALIDPHAAAMAHSLPFAMEHLPSLKELSNRKDLKQLAQHLLHRTLTYIDHSQPLKKK